MDVPTAADDALVNNGGTATISGLITPTARSLAIGSGGAASQSGTVTTTDGLDLSVVQLLQVGFSSGGGTANGSLQIDGSVRGLNADDNIGSLFIGAADDAGSTADGSLTVVGNLQAGQGAVGRVTTGDGASAKGSLTVGGNLSGLAAVGQERSRSRSRSTRFSMRRQEPN